MSLFSKLFGGKKPAEVKPDEHQGFRIFVTPISESGGYRVSARIEKDVDGAVKSYKMIRADVCSSRDEADKTSLLKAQILIDQQGDDIFDLQQPS